MNPKGKVTKKPKKVAIATPAAQLISMTPVPIIKPKSEAKVKVALLYINTNDMNARLEIAEANLQKIADYLNSEAK